MDLEGRCEIRRLDDDQLLYSLPTPGRPGTEAPGARPAEGEAGQDSPALARSVCPRLSRDGRFLAAWYRPYILSHCGSLWLWRLSREGEPELLLQEPDVFLVSDFDQTGRHLALRYGTGDVSIFQLDPTQPARRLRRIPTGLLQRPEAFALHPTRPWLALAYDDPNYVQIYDYESGALLRTLLLLHNVGHLAWHPTGTLLAISARHRGVVQVFDTTNRQLLQTLTTEGKDARLAFNPAGDRLAAFSTQWRVELFDLSTGKLLVVSSRSTTNRQIRFSRDGRRLTSGLHGDRVGIWEVADGRESRILPLPEDPVAGRVWAAIGVWTDSRLLAVPIKDRYQFWDLDTSQKVGELPVPSLWLGPFVPASPDGPGALLAQGPKGLFRWPIQPRGGDPATLQIGPPQPLDAPLAHWTGCSRDGRLVAGASPHGGDFARFAGGWVLRADRPAPPLFHLEKGADCCHLAIHPDGGLVVIAPMPAGANRVWDVSEETAGSSSEPASGRLVKVLDSASGHCSCFSPDGQWLAVSGEAGALFDVATWERELPFVGWAQFSPDSRLLAVDTKKGYIRLIDIRRGRDLAWFEDPNQEMEGLHMFTPDGTRLLYHTYGRPDGLRVWDLRTIRRQLKAMDLDWDAPDYPPAPDAAATPLRLEIRP
jgi:WD40 repeat protein